MNVTFNVASFYDCDKLSDYVTNVNSFDPIWRQTELGCQMLRVLKDMYGFKVSYVPEDVDANMSTVINVVNTSNSSNQSVDIYLRPMGLALQHLDNMYPVHAAYAWKFGFILRLSGTGFYRTFYSKPFSRPVWNCLYGMALFVSIFFFILKKWEFSVVGGWKCSYPYELLMVIGAYCQHIPPIEPKLSSRRIAYFIYFIFAYIIYTFYTSNLLSHLVNDKNHVVTLETLAASDIECVIVDYMILTVSENIPTNSINHGIIVQKLRKLRAVSITEGIVGVKAGKLALLSDYISLYPYAKQFTPQEVCEISTIDMISNIKKYLFTSKEFAYKEEFKIGTLRAKETGVLKDLKVKQSIPKCGSSNTVETHFVQISTPIIILFCTYIVSVFILLIERVHYKRNKVWPYVN